ncbi:MAG: O-antigen ligase family protein, partial [Actinomycetia bacterium]|nr:O-antigen ligase family protein [Actinomycetes bacterium]
NSLSIGLSRLITLLLLVFLYFLTIDLVQDAKTLRKILLTLVVSGAFAALIPIVQFLFNGFKRSAGATLDPNYSALSFLILIPLAFALANEAKKMKLLGFGIIIILLLGGSTLTFSRGGLVAVLAIFMILPAQKLLANRLRWSAAFILLLMVASLFLVKHVDPRFSLDNIKVSGGSGRLDIWTGAHKIFVDHWFTGTGLGNFSVVYFKYASNMPSIKPWHVAPTVAHNLFIETAAETGLLGAATFLAFLGSVVFGQKRSKQHYLHKGFRSQALVISMLSVSMVGFLIASLFISTLFLKIFWILLGLHESTRPLFVNGVK